MKNVNRCPLKAKMTSSNVLFCPQLTNIQFTVTEEERNQEIFTFKELESESFDPFLQKELLKLIKRLSRRLINLIVDNKSNNWLITAAIVSICLYTSILTCVKFMSSISTEMLQNICDRWSDPKSHEMFGTTNTNLSLPNHHFCSYRHTVCFKMYTFTGQIRKLQRQQTFSHSFLAILIPVMVIFKPPSVDNPIL